MNDEALSTQDTAAQWEVRPMKAPNGPGWYYEQLGVDGDMYALWAPREATKDRSERDYWAAGFNLANGEAGGHRRADSATKALTVFPPDARGQAAMEALLAAALRGEAHVSTYPLTPERAYTLMQAALDVIGSVSPQTLKRCRADVKANRGGSRPTISPRDMAALADAVEAIDPGIIDRLHRIQRESAAAAQ